MLRFKEQVATALAAQAEAFTGKEWDVVLIEAGWSLNRGESGRPRYYPAKVLQESVQLFEGLEANIFLFGDRLDHLPDEAMKRMPEGFAANKVGFYQQVRFGEFTRPDGTKGQGIIGKLHILEGCEWLRKNMKDAWDHGKFDLYQFSIDADGESQPSVVEGKDAEVITRIMAASSTDVVSKGAAGGSVLRLVASMGAPTVDKLLALLKTNRARWLEGHTKTAEQSDADYLLGIFQGNLAKAKDVLATAALKEADQAQAVARGVEAIGKVITLLQEGKADEAETVLAGWISKHAALQEGDAGALALSDYSIPADKPAAPAAPAAAAAPAAPAASVNLQASAPAAPSIDDRVAGIEKRERLHECRLSLSGSKLPEAAQKRVMEKMDHLVVGDDYMAKLQEAVTSEREYIQGLREASANFTGLGHAHADGGRVNVGAGELDKHIQAMDGYFNNDGKDVGGVPRFHSIHEAYIKIMQPRQHLSKQQLADRIMFCMGKAVSGRVVDDTGEHLKSLRESWSRHAGTRIRESIEQGDFAVAFGDSMFRRMQREGSDASRNDWQDLVSSRENNQDLDNPVKIFRTGGISQMPVVGENAAYQELDPITPTEESTDLVVEKRGGLVKVSLEAVLADRNRVIRQIPVKLGRSSARTVQTACFDPIELNQNTQDGNPLLDAAHNNIVGAVLSYASMVSAVLLMRNQLELDTNEKLGLEPEFLWVPNELEATAVEILESLVKITTAEDSTVRSFINRLGIQVKKSVSLGRTAGTNDRAYLTARRGDSEGIAVGFLNGKETPDLFVQGPNDTPTSGEAFTADVLTFKARMPVEAVAVDHRFIVGINIP